ncbi:hypothetical protein LTR10_013715 [Elasticomyces elasticus]|uniref:Cas1p 10 TM acyl transferase domain-containing protein n=1 Tax=Exophiala sideris TaxID=1016849 RepID=A0ABR0JGK6_9EURO|nr:hypothetical protein LTR10_013715 [Elasticomyces elasticus]KAK5033309.1 hypothetical protein LTS07_003611 [Exophiala sideris]KAK5042193.1 hypothetical protein LTR13_001999 [Exophiala sideris]KAK5063853.1 hypothetical protein LTR69_003619 [Exophiala sideris]KAK5185461.1 hypothetical protein LTR44_002450 [Eurotiomycetes sp. CCFEE 6388]
MLHIYDSSDARKCLSTRSLTFLGDSTARQLFWAIARQLDFEQTINASAMREKHTNITFAAEGADIVFIWDPFLNETNILNGSRVTNTITSGFKPDVVGFASGTSTTNSFRSKCKSDVLVIGAGLWHVKYFDDSYLPHLREGIRSKSISRFSGPELNLTVDHGLETILLPIAISEQSSGDLSRPQTLTQERITAANAAIVGASTSLGHKVLLGNLNMVDNMPSAFMADGIHLQDRIASTQAQVVLNYMCNDIIDVPRKQSQAYCCSAYIAPHPLQHAILLGGIYLIVYYLLSLLFRYCFDDSKALPRTQRVVGGLAKISFGALWFATFKPASVTTTIPKDGTTAQFTESSEWQILSRDQTEEWKGWMQIIILLYHYFSMSKVLWVYQFVRLLVAAYIFMTAWGHTMYFIRTNDFSLRRVVNVLMRTNLLNVILAYVMGTQYDLYYFPVLASVWFLIVWIIVPRASSSGARVRPFFLRLALSITIVSIIRSKSAALEGWLNGLDSLGPGVFNINAREFLFRFSLDAYIAYFGMVVAFFYSLFGATSGQESFGVAHWSFSPTKLIMLVAACNLVGYMLFCGRFSNKYDYNRWHPFISPLPVMAFVVLRNSTARLSTSYSRLFAWFGRCSLETFVLQYHIWLAADTHGLLRLGLADLLLHRYGIKHTYCYDILDTLIISVTFLGISHSVSKAMPVVVTSFVGGRDDRTFLKRWKDPIKDNMTMRTSIWGSLSLQHMVMLALATLWVLNCTWNLWD